MLSPKSQLSAWYAGSTALDGVAIMGLATLFPMVLEQLARGTAHWSPEYQIPCSEPKPTEGSVCRALILGKYLETTSFTLYVRSIATICTFFALVSLGPITDDPYWRKFCVVAAPYLSALAMIMFLFFPSRPSSIHPLLAALLLLMITIGVMLGAVSLDSYLPIIARQIHATENESRLIESTQDLARHDPAINSSESDPLLASNGQSSGPSKYTTLNRHAAGIKTHNAENGDEEDEEEEKDEFDLALTTSRMASVAGGLAAMYSLSLQIGSHFVLAANISLETCVAFVAVAYMIIASPMFTGLPSGKIGTETKWTDGWVKTGKLLTTWRKLPMLWRVLMTWWCQSDAFYTIPLATIMQSTTRLGFAPSQVITITAVAMVTLGITSFVAPPLQRWTGASNVTVAVLGCLIGLIAPLWGASSIVNPNWGFRSSRDVYTAIAFMGSSFGLYFNYHKAVYAEMVPRGHESSFFSLYALAARSSAFLGPLIVGSITQSTGRFDFAWLVLALIMAVPIPVLASVKTSVGLKQALAYNENETESIDT